MFIERLFSRNDVMVEKAMDSLALRMEASSNNLANVNTPGYARQSVDFESALAEAYEATPKYLMSGGDEGPSSSLLQMYQPAIRKDTAGAQRLDGNTISQETEMTNLVETTIAFNALARRTGFSTLKTIIQNAR
jgi:flagellar basal-body rod protein FlgB